jgi:sigma-B regulation protein RsbU (phosphoserine phosphatase)
LSYSSAGHPPLALVPTIRRPALLNGKGGLPLGLLEASLPFEVSRQRLEPGDRVYLYTDGLVEWANEEQEQYGEARLLESLGRGRCVALQESVALALRDVRAYVREAPCPDDLTLIGLEFDPGKERA